jgi:hypothetical protein
MSIKIIEREETVCHTYVILRDREFRLSDVAAVVAELLESCVAEPLVIHDKRLRDELFELGLCSTNIRGSSFCRNKEKLREFETELLETEPS